MSLVWENPSETRQSRQQKKLRIEKKTAHKWLKWLIRKREKKWLVNGSNGPSWSGAGHKPDK